MRKGNSGGNEERRGAESGEKTDGNSGQYVIASSRPPKHRLLDAVRSCPKNVLHGIMFLNKLFILKPYFFLPDMYIIKLDNVTVLLLWFVFVLFYFSICQILTAIYSKRNNYFACNALE